MDETKKLISVVSPCYNEEGNIEALVERVRALFADLPQYRYEHIIIDNHSSDGTVEKLRAIAAVDKNVKVILNARNFGHIRSPQHALMEAKGDAVVVLLSDLQDPPELIKDFVREWEAGWPIVVAIKTTSEESGLMYAIRTAYYSTIAKLTNVKVFEHFTGFGLYDRRVMDILRKDFRDPQPYFRGQIAEIGLPSKVIPYNQKRRTRGITKNNFYTLYDMAMLGITNLSKVPLRAVIFFGFICAGLSLVAAFFYLVMKLVFWSRFE
ncbi:MAG: glycosyltransferase family 2 protein, partial [Acidobacteriota bacterium]|nr:glycosyltransferase family 2 protein [Acidobacteriota bacterium]